MNQTSGFVDIHCHLLPGIDDGAKSWDESLAMARMAVADGIETIVVTPHQLGGFAQNHGDAIRQRTEELAEMLAEHEIPLAVLPGADVRIEAGMIGLVRAGRSSLAGRSPPAHPARTSARNLCSARPLAVGAERRRHGRDSLASRAQRRNHGQSGDRRRRWSTPAA